MIKKSITQNTCPGFEPEADWAYPPSGKKRDRSALNTQRTQDKPQRQDRGERREGEGRRERDSDRPGRNRYEREGRDRPSSTNAYTPPRLAKVAADGFDFTKPYEATASDVSGESPTANAPSASRRPTRMVAALLGGLKKPPTL